MNLPTPASLRPNYKPELLSPAGNWECAKAAVANGADAIFFGLPQFNARMRADNFSNEDLPELMQYLHRHGVKGFVTMNTLIFANELEAAEEQLKVMEAAGVDAAIIQDLGLARLIRKVAPSIELHASTQMTITSPEGLSFLDDHFGFERAVLARELSVEEISKFKPHECTPLEVFVHGALCVAYSGQCLTSESLGQRSANRGECAQACRMPYELWVDGEKQEMAEVRYLLSPQDLAAVDLIPDLVKQGVVSFKIEGRLKAPEYVAAVTQVYRKAIDAAMKGLSVKEEVTQENRYSLEMTFSRGLSNGWLGGTNHPYLTHGKWAKKRGAYLGEIIDIGGGWIEIKREPGMPLNPQDGIVIDAGEDRNHEQGCRVWKVEGDRLYADGRSELDWGRVKIGQRIFKTSDPSLDKRLRKSWKDSRETASNAQDKKPSLGFLVRGEEGQPMTVESQGVLIQSASLLTEASNRPIDDALLIKQLGRLGNTSFVLGRVTNELKGDVMLPIKEINEIKRQLVEAIESGAKQENLERGTLSQLLKSPEKDQAPSESSQLYVLCRSLAQVESAIRAEVKRVYCDFEDIRGYSKAVALCREIDNGTQIFLATPRIQKPNEVGYFKLIERQEPDGVLIRNLGGLEYFKDKPLIKVGDFSLNVSNPLTADFLQEQGNLENLTISYDLNLGQVQDLLASSVNPTRQYEQTLHQHMPLFHMEHCVFCTFLSEGTTYKDCGRPCEKHKVQLRDRVGQLHTLAADVGCRNTLFNGRAQTGANFYQSLYQSGLRQFRIELLEESAKEASKTIRLYQDLLGRSASGYDILNELEVTEKLGVTEGNLVARRQEMHS